MTIHWRLRGLILPETRFGAFDTLNNTNMNQRTLSLKLCAVAMMSVVLMLQSISEHQYCNASTDLSAWPSSHPGLNSSIWHEKNGMVLKYIVMKKNNQLFKKYLVLQQAFKAFNQHRTKQTCRTCCCITSEGVCLHLLKIATHWRGFEKPTCYMLVHIRSNWRSFVNIKKWGRHSK